MVLLPSQHQSEQGLIQSYIARQQTIPHPTSSYTLPISAQPTVSDVATLPEEATQPTLLIPKVASKKQTIARFIAIAFALALVTVLYFTWHSDAPQPVATTGVTQQSFGPSTTSKSTATESHATTSGGIQVYIVGAVRHPGVYTLPTNARMFQLLQAAGGTLPNANLVALNLAAKLSDGQEVYVAAHGENPPTLAGNAPSATDGVTPGQLININTASADEMRQNLHISSATAQNIVNYRSQHSAFTAVDQLTQVVSKAIYNKIKGQVTI